MCPHMIMQWREKLSLSINKMLIGVNSIKFIHFFFAIRLLCASINITANSKLNFIFHEKPTAFGSNTEWIMNGKFPQKLINRIDYLFPYRWSKLDSFFCYLTQFKYILYIACMWHESTELSTQINHFK